ncbi:reverse transcriptase domain-containing protein [Tanacetum coccineum]
MKLNPKKCSFGVEEGKFLGYMVTSEGIRANPKKREAILGPSVPLKSIERMQEASVETSSLNHRNGRQCPVQYVSRTLNEAERNYSPLEKLALSLVNMTRRLRRVNSFSDAPDGEREDEYFQSPEVPPEIDDTETWTLYTDGAASSKGSGAGLILTGPSGVEYAYALRLTFASTNNEAEYEALLAGLRIARMMNVPQIEVKDLLQAKLRHFWGIHMGSLLECIWVPRAGVRRQESKVNMWPTMHADAQKPERWSRYGQGDIPFRDVTRSFVEYGLQSVHRQRNMGHKLIIRHLKDVGVKGNPEAVWKGQETRFWREKAGWERGRLSSAIRRQQIQVKIWIRTTQQEKYVQGNLDGEFVYRRMRQVECEEPREAGYPSGKAHTELQRLRERLLNSLQTNGGQDVPSEDHTDNSLRGKMIRKGTARRPERNKSHRQPSHKGIKCEGRATAAPEKIDNTTDNQVTGKNVKEGTASGKNKSHDTSFTRVIKHDEGKANSPPLEKE